MRSGRIAGEGHARHDTRRVEPAAEECRYRHVTLEVCRHRSVQPFPHPRLGVWWTGALVQRELPVAAGDNTSIAPPLERVTGLELANVAERRRRGRDVSHLEERVQRLPVERAGRQLRGVQRLELRSERDSPRSGE